MSRSKFLFKRKDGGPDSTVTGYWLCEFKDWFSIVLLKFEGQSRAAYHSHAFNAYSWVLKGHLKEHTIGQYATGKDVCYGPSLKPIYTPKNNFHQVDSHGTTWVLSFRGPWSRYWQELDTRTGETYTLKEGRVKVSFKDSSLLD